LTRRRGELSATCVDREWPHQVALPAERVQGKQHGVVDDFCRELTVCSRTRTVHRDGVDYIVFCFGQLAHANLFRARFIGERFDPADRGHGREWSIWRRQQKG
jgi:hypothetical protein